MARRRISAQRRRARGGSALAVAQGVHSIALDLGGDASPLPLQALAPLIYVAEMMASLVCQARGWQGARHELVSQYFLQGATEALVGMLASFDEDHFERWIAALEEQQERTLPHAGRRWRDAMRTALGSD